MLSLFIHHSVISLFPLRDWWRIPRLSRSGSLQAHGARTGQDRAGWDAYEYRLLCHRSVLQCDVQYCCPLEVSRHVGAYSSPLFFLFLTVFVWGPFWGLHSGASVFVHLFCGVLGSVGRFSPLLGGLGPRAPGHFLTCRWQVGYVVVSFSPPPPPFFFFWSPGLAQCLVGSSPVEGGV